VDAAKYAPLLCAGSTVFNAIKSANLKPGNTVAVQGLGGLGHMAVQFARKLGYRVIAISRGSDKEKSVRALGAHEFIDATAGDPGEALKNLGYADLVLTTAMETAAMTPLIKGIGIFGKLMILSFPQSGQITLDSNEMIMRSISVQSWSVGNCFDCEKTVAFAHQQNLESAVETYPLAKAQDAFDAMLSGKVRYRAVITM
jgi:D-arabinose 1-dehydrogenase-like Zn-dependent alcohol dehydrogenase